MRSTSRWATLGAGLLLTTTTLAACSGGGGTDAEDDPRTALSEAIEALGDYDGIELTLSIDGDRDAIVAAAGDDLDERTADLLLDSSLLMRAAGEDEADAQAEFVVNLGDEQAVEVRVLPEQRFFVRVDLDAITTAIDDPEATSSLDEGLGMASAFGLGEVVTAVRNGDWIELTGTEQLAELAGGANQEDEPTEEEVEDVRARIVASLQRFLDQDVELTHVGEESEGERITATTTEADLAALFEEITSIASDLSGVDADALGAELDEVEASDREIDIDFWIDGGRLRQVGFDLSQVEGEDSAPEGTYVLATMDEFSGSVEAPDEATEIDLFAIIGEMFGGGFGEGGFGEDGLEATDDGALEGADGGDLEDGGDPLGGECIPQEQLDELTGGDPEAEAELEAAIEQGFIEVC